MKITKNKLVTTLELVQNKLKNEVVSKALLKFLDDPIILDNFEKIIGDILSSVDNVMKIKDNESIQSFDNYLNEFLSNTESDTRITLYHVKIIDSMNFTINFMSKFEKKGFEDRHDYFVNSMSSESNLENNKPVQISTLEESSELINLTIEEKNRLLTIINDVNSLFLPYVNAIEINGYFIQDFLVLVPIEEHLSKISTYLKSTNDYSLEFFINELQAFKVHETQFYELEKLEIYEINDVTIITNKMHILYNKVQELIKSLVDKKGHKEKSTDTTGHSIAKGRTDKIFDKHENPVLNIVSVAKVFSKYIIKYNAESTSTIIGIFAKWGRGKTFFYKLLKKEISEKNKNIFFCEFQPWKYQQNESAWAYLYKNILDSYLNTDKKYKWFSWIRNRKLIKIVRLNTNRLGQFDLIKNILILFTLLSLVFIPRMVQVEFLISWLYYIYAIGYGGLIVIGYKFYKFYLGQKNTIIKLIDNYGKSKDYSSYLGFQNEIERELKYLICSFITKEEERLILFIDDMDRCNEVMIINLMDSFRLVLEDKEINNKLTIITALDERILLKSIKHKYYDNDTSDKKINPKEYIEKFFLIALKLNQLNDQDKFDLVDEYTKLFNSTFIDKTLHEQVSPHQSVGKDISLEENTELSSNLVKSTKVSEDNNKESPITSNIELEILNYNEISFLKKLIVQYDIETPRKINMMIQRYLLFKNFIIEELNHNNIFDYRLYISLVFYALNENGLKNLFLKYTETNSKEIHFDVDGNSFKITREEYIILIKYAEMVSPF